MTLRAISGREASIFACVTDTIVAPEPALPAVRHTSAVAFFDRWLERSPRLNRLGLRALLYLAELAPLATGAGARLRRLDDPARARALEALAASRSASARQIVKLIKGVACLAYYGDDAVMRRLGYDPDVVVARARALRASEGRP